MVLVRTNIPSIIAILGERKLEVEGTSLLDTLQALEERFAGVTDEILVGERFAPHLMVVVQFAGADRPELASDPHDSRVGLAEVALMAVPEGG